jgi:hypothetical protein
MIRKSSALVTKPAARDVFAVALHVCRRAGQARLPESNPT